MAYPLLKILLSYSESDLGSLSFINAYILKKGSLRLLLDFPQVYTSISQKEALHAENFKIS